MSIPKPEPKDWLKAAADELRIGDRETLKLLQEAYRNVNRILGDLPDQPTAPLGNLVYRAQLERTKKQLLEQQVTLFTKLGDLTAARRLKSATRAAKLSRAADNALLLLVGKGDDGKRLYDSAEITAQRTVETMLARIGLSQVPLSERIYKTTAWMNGRLDKLINQTMAAGLNARRFAKVARDWFAPSVPGGTRYAAMRLARTEINNAFHATSISYAQSKPWVSQMDWNLSKSHPAKDKCDLYAAESPWPVISVPRKPHPQCLCYVTETEVGEDEWIDRFVAGEFDDYLNRELGIVDSPVDSGTVSSTGTPVQVQDVQPPEIPQKLNQPEGYKPGNWKLFSDNEVRIQEMAAEVKKLNKALDDDKALEFARTILAETSSDAEVSFRNGPHEITFRGKLTPEKQQEFLGYVDHMQSRFPADRKMTIMVDPSDQFDWGTGGETTLSTGHMRINERVMLQDFWAGMPVSKNVPSALYVLAHEWGHAFPSKEDARNTKAHKHAVQAGGMTRYGTQGGDGEQGHASEGYAEAFAEWSLTDGKTTNPAAIEYAREFRWEERFGNRSD